jgi:hypothetical protein
MASIEFESRVEVEQILDIVALYLQQHPKEKENEVLMRFYHLLDIMDLEW